MKQRFVIATFALAAATNALAQQYPSRAVRMIIPAGPGGGVDTISRVVGQPLSAALGEPVIMDNRPGAGTMLASELTAKAPPDGYTLLMATNSHAINAAIHKSLRYDPVNDFSTLFPGVPTVSESGLPGYQADVWYGVMLPARTPPEIVARLNREIVTILKSREVREKFASQGAEVLAGTPEAFGTVLRNDIGKWGKVTAGLKLQME